MSKMKVPFFDLSNQTEHLIERILNELKESVQKGDFILGSKVNAFESAFANFLGSNYAVGVANGTDAIRLAFEVLDLERGSEVLVPAHTFVATALGVLEAGLRPVLVDVDPETYHLDLEKAELSITSKTKAICPVHLYGRVMDMDRLLEFTEKYNLCLIEDTAQAHGAKFKGKCVGTFGDFGTFSFYPSKNLGAYGDGGLVVTNKKEYSDRLKAYRNYGSEIKYHYPVKGLNSRLDNLQALVLLEKLPLLNEENIMRYNVAKRYHEGLKDFSEQKLKLPSIGTEDGHVYHLFEIEVEERDLIKEFLEERGVQSGIHYPRPYYLEPGFSFLGYKEGDFPVADRISKRLLSLPMYPHLSNEQVDYVCEVIGEFISN